MKGRRVRPESWRMHSVCQKTHLLVTRRKYIANASIVSSEIYNSQSHVCEVGMGFAFLVNGIRISHNGITEYGIGCHVVRHSTPPLHSMAHHGVRHSTFTSHGIAQYSICLNGVHHLTNSTQGIDQLVIGRVCF